MREERMRELMQQELAVPRKVHDAFERGIEQVAHMDMEQAGTTQKAGQKGRQIFWRRAGLVAAAVAAVCVISFHSQIYGFAKSLFIHDTITVGEKANVQEADVKIIKIKDGVLTDDGERSYFESMEDLGGKLGISFLKSPAENTVTGKGKVVAMMDDTGIVTVQDSLYSVNDVSKIEYTEDGESYFHYDAGKPYSIMCKADFYTKVFQDDMGTIYEGADVIEEYETANGFQATLFQHYEDDLNAVIYCDNIRYEYSVDNCLDEDDSICTLKDFKAFLDTLTK